MLQDLIDWARAQLTTNEIASGGALLVIFSSVAYMCRQIPRRLWYLLKRQLLVTISFDDNSGVYTPFATWLNRNNIFSDKRSVTLSADTTLDPAKLLTLPDRASYFVRLGGVYCLLRRARDEDNSGAQADGGIGMKMLTPERYWITCLYFQRSRIEALLTDILNTKETDGTEVYTFDHSYWRLRFVQTPHSIDNVVLQDGLAASLLADLRKFLDSRAWYDERQLPYQRGYLFVGPPGTGKTSVVKAMAAECGLCVCTLDLASVNSDKNLTEAFLTLPRKAIILIEDFDSYFEGRRCKVGNKHETITFSGLLNAINGVITTPGRVLVITTNEVDHIDPALTRVGRIDRTFRLSYVDADQTVRLGKRFFAEDLPDADALTRFAEQVAHSGNVSPADLLGHWQRYAYPQSLDFDLLLKDREERITLEKEIADIPVDVKPRCVAVPV